MGRILARHRRQALWGIRTTETGSISQAEDTEGASAQRNQGATEPASRAPKGGRPRLDHRPGFARRFAQVLRSLERGETSKAEAARLLGISRRSVNRYMKLASGHVGLMEADVRRGP